MTRLSCHRFRANEVRLWLSVIAYNLGNLWRRLALPAAVANWSLTSLQQRLVKTGGRLIKRPLLLVAAGGEPPDAAALRQHAPQDRGVAVTGGIGGPQSAADFDDEMGGREKCLRNRLYKRHFWWLRGRETLNQPIPARLAALWAKLGQNLAQGGRLAYMRS